MDRESRKQLKTLKECEWKVFTIEEIGEILSGCDIYDADRIEGNTPYITAKATNNGINYFVGNKNNTLESKCISVNRNGSVGYAFYHEYPALYGNDTRKIRPFKQNRYVALFLATVISQQRDKYAYGYKMGTARLKKQKILLPATSDRKPDYAYMEVYMRRIEKRQIDKYEAYIKESYAHLPPPNEQQRFTQRWKPFRLCDIFDFRKGNQNQMNITVAGTIPLVSARKVENGYKSFILYNGKPLFDGECISLNLDGDGGAGLAFYQPHKMALDTHVAALFPRRKLSKYSMLFIAGCIPKQRAMFGHGRAITMSRLNKMQILLPAKGNQPDYASMENHMKYLAKKQLLEYMNYRKLVEEK